MGRHLLTAAAAATLCNEKTSVRSTFSFADRRAAAEEHSRSDASNHSRHRRRYRRLQHYIVRVDTNGGNLGVAPGHPGLQLGRAAQRIHNAAELDEKAVASKRDWLAFLFGEEVRPAR
jgi:hypothetical protein